MMSLLPITFLIGTIIYFLPGNFFSIGPTYRALEDRRRHLEKIISQLLNGPQNLGKIDWGEDYFGMTVLIKELMTLVRSSGLQLRPTLRKIRIALSERGQFERKVYQEKSGALAQILIMIFLVWAMVMAMSLLSEFILRRPSLYFLASYQMMILIVFNLALELPKRRWLTPFSRALRFHYSLHAQILGGRPLNHALATLRLEDCLKGLGDEVVNVYEHFLQRLRSGSVAQDDWDSLEQDLYYYQSLALECFQRRATSIKMLAVVLGGPGGLIFLMYEFMSQQGMLLQ